MPSEKKYKCNVMRQLIPLEHSTKLKPIHQPQIGHALQDEYYTKRERRIQSYTLKKCEWSIDMYICFCDLCLYTIFMLFVCNKIQSSYTHTTLQCNGILGTISTVSS